MAIGPVTSGDFRTKNAILFSTQIRKDELQERYIDANNNGSLDREVRQAGNPSHPLSVFSNQEPVLDVSMEQLQAFAQARGLQVVTGDDVELNGQFKTVIVRESGEVAQTITRRSVPLQDLVPALAPLDTGAKWAIDLGTGTCPSEFLVYVPRA